MLLTSVWLPFSIVLLESRELAYFLLWISSRPKFLTRPVPALGGVWGTPAVHKSSSHLLHCPGGEEGPCPGSCPLKNSSAYCLPALMAPCHQLLWHLEGKNTSSASGFALVYVSKLHRFERVLDFLNHRWYPSSFTLPTTMDSLFWNSFTSISVGFGEENEANLYVQALNLTQSSVLCCS